MVVAFADFDAAFPVEVIAHNKITDLIVNAVIDDSSGGCAHIVVDAAIALSS